MGLYAYNNVINMFFPVGAGCSNQAFVRHNKPERGVEKMEVVDTVVIVLLIFLLIILLGLQMQITTTNRDMVRIEDRLREIMDKLNSLQKG